MSNFAGDPVCLLDIRGLLLRRFHGASGGEKGSAKAGLQEFLERDLEEILEIYPPRNILACWDRGNDYRRKLYPAYKQARRDKESSPEEKAEINDLFSMSKNVLRALGVKSVSVPGVEADDVIALFCEKLKGPVTVWTIDADLLQLVTDPQESAVDTSLNQVIVRHGDTLFTSAHQTHNGVPLYLLGLYKSIVGDSSDGYSGVPGVGPAGWESLVEFVGLDGMDELKGIIERKDRASLEEAVHASDHKVLSKLLSGWEAWTVSHTLAKLHPEICHMVVDGKIISPAWDVAVPNVDKLSRALFACGASDMLDRYHKWMPTETLYDKSNVSELAQLQRTLQTAPIVSFDFESYDTLGHEDFRKAAHSSDFVDTLSQRITGMSVNYGDNCQHTFYVSVEHAETDNASRDWVVWLLRVLFSRGLPTVVQNANFELTLCLTDLGFDYKELTPLCDTAIMSTYVDENMENHLKALSLEWLNYRQTTYREVVGERKMNELPAVEVLSYGCDDSLVTSHLFSLFRMIMETEGSWGFYLKNETTHAIDSVRTFIDGCPIDLDLIKKFSEEDHKVIETADLEIRAALSDHCTQRTQEEVMGPARELLNMWWELPSMEYVQREDGPQISSEKQELGRKKYAEMWESAWASCFYTPYKEVVVRPEFSLTPAKMNEVSVLVGCPGLRFEKSLSGNQVSEWLEAADDCPETQRGLAKEWVDQVQSLAKVASSLQKRASKGGFGSLEKDEIENLPEYEEFLGVVNRIYDANNAGRRTTEGDELNYSSSKQMQAFLYGKLGLPVRRYGKVSRGSARDQYGLQGPPITGNKASAAAIVYDTPEGDWRRPVLMSYRQIIACQQNISLFYDPYPLWVHPRDGNIHPQVKNCGTVTRRPSGTSPNILQVSKKEGAKIRKVFLPWKGGEQYIHVSLDFVGQEVVITACESKDSVMLDALSRRMDVHSLTSTGFSGIMASRVLGQQIDRHSYEEFKGLKVSHPALYKQIRDAAKAVLFLVFYGGGAGTLAENLLIDIDLAKEIIFGLHETYPRLRGWQEEVIEFSRSHGYVETAYGNRRHLNEELFAEEQGFQRRQERQAINYCIQGCAADILKIVLTKIRRREMLDRYQIKGLKPVYDEISAMVPLSKAGEYIAEMQEVMAIRPPGYPLSLSTDVSVGLRWGDVEELTDYSQSGVETVIAKQLEARAASC